MGIEELVTSPTFAIENEYQTGNTDLFHFDAWRLQDSTELRALNFEELIKNKKVISVEWAERVADIIREFDDEAIIIWIKIEYGSGDSVRIISWGVEQ